MTREEDLAGELRQTKARETQLEETLEHERYRVAEALAMLSHRYPGEPYKAIRGAVAALEAAFPRESVAAQLQEAKWKLEEARQELRTLREDVRLWRELAKSRGRRLKRLGEYVEGDLDE